MKPLVVYHANCPDGFTAAWAVWRDFDEVELYVGHYGDDPPYALAEGRTVYVVDFSYPREKLLKLHRVARQLRVFDHHKTAEADLRGLDFCTFDMERSGAGLTWDLMHPGEQRPWVVDYVEDRDLWRHKLPHSREVSLFIRSCEHDLDAWDEMAEMSLHDVLEQAKGCRRYLDHYVRNAAGRAYEIAIPVAGLEVSGGVYEWIPAVCVNLTYTGVSDVLERLLEQKPRVDLAVGWHVSPGGGAAISLRSREGFDCSEVARVFGGGGHAQAAGCRLERVPAWLLGA